MTPGDVLSHLQVSDACQPSKSIYRRTKVKCGTIPSSCMADAFPKKRFNWHLGKLQGTNIGSVTMNRTNLAKSSAES